MGGIVIFEIDKIDNKFIYLENIIMNAYSDIFVSFHKIYTQIVEHGTQAVIKRVYWLSVFKIDQNKYTEGHFMPNKWGLLSQHFYILWS